MAVLSSGVTANARRTPLGVRGLKFFGSALGFDKLRRTPSGVRGLKFATQRYDGIDLNVAPRQGCVD